MDNKFQHDFFGDLQREKEARKRRFLDRHSKHRLLPHLRVPMEHVVVAGIAVLVLVIVAYALGVERGKRSVSAGGREEISSETQVVINEDVTLDAPAPASPVVQQPAEVFGAVYVIQLASFRDLSTAQQEIEKLREKRYNAMFKKSGSWYKVYAEGYQSMEEAERAKKELDKYYKDCYIRRTK